MIRKYIIFIGLIFISCNGFIPKEEIYQPEYTPKISVFSIISVNDKTEFVVVERTLRINEDDDPYLNEAQRIDPIIDDAVVKIFSDTDTVQFSFFKKHGGYQDEYYGYNSYYNKGIYLDLNDEFNAEPGNTYNLSVQVPDGRIVTAATTVPETPVITKPSVNDILSRQSFSETEVSWNNDDNTVAYVVSLLVEDNNQFGSFRFDILDDKLVYESPTKLDNGDFEYFNFDNFEDIITIKVTALDRNLFDYAQKSGLASLIGSELYLVDGGVGVFGSISVDSVDVEWR